VASKISFYLAARFSRRDELCGYMDTLEQRGFHVTSRWLTQHQALDLSDKRAVYTNQDRTQFAIHDYEDVQRAQRLIAFTEDPNDKIAVNGRRGGRHVELGLALAWAKHIYVVGYRENVFCSLPQVMFYETFDRLLETLT
jgi:hypothetical protein